MPTPLTYTTLQQELVTALVQAPPPYNVIPPDFASLYPNAISFSESRICAEIPLLANQTQNTQLSTTNGSRQLNLSGMTNPLVVMDRLSLISGVTRYQYVKMPLDFIDLVWPNPASTQSPVTTPQSQRFWAPLNAGSTSGAYSGSSSLIVLAPTPDGTYTAECTGLFQPPPLTSGNPTTYLSTVYPDLLVAACMVFLTGALMRNYGAVAADPAQAISWEAAYEKLKAACEFEEIRRRGLVYDVPQPQRTPG